MTKDAMGNGLARKATRFMTNSPCIAMKLEKRCPNRNGIVQHRHVILQGGRTKAAQVYLDGLCGAICEGLIQQLEMDQKGQFLLAQLDGIEQEKKDVEQQIAERCPTVEHDECYALGKAWDDVTGAELNPSMIKKARQEDVQYVRKMGLYRKVSKEECWKCACKKPIQVRWIDVFAWNSFVPAPFYPDVAGLLGNAGSSSNVTCGSFSAISSSIAVGLPSSFISTGTWSPFTPGTGDHGFPCILVTISRFHLCFSGNLFTVRHFATPFFFLCQ